MRPTVDCRQSTVDSGSRSGVHHAFAVVACLALAGCSRGTDHERLGDRRYAEQAWVDAVAEYRLAARQHRPSLELRAKLGAAALHAGALSDAATAFAELGAADHTAVQDAAEGLLRTARAAIVARDVGAFQLAVGALQRFAPLRVPELGSGLAFGLEDRRGLDRPDLVLAAAAGASGPAADSLMAIWADATARSGRCDVAARAFDALARRAATTTIARAARGGLAGCRVDAGRVALAAGQLDVAEEQFRAAVAIGVPDSTVRLAWVLIGDTRWAGGDTVVAIESYRKAMVGADEDNPVAQRARDQLRRLTGNPDSS
jgi:tetratricopeptide (TPR) repeat protein